MSQRSQMLNQTRKYLGWHSITYTIKTHYFSYHVSPLAVKSLCGIIAFTSVLRDPHYQSICVVCRRLVREMDK